MGAGYLWRCGTCDYEVRTSGPWEFFRDKKGRRKFFGHPCPISDEAVEAGISGLSAVLYCPICDRTADRIIVEYKNPVIDDKISIWLGMPEPKEKYQKSGAVKCRKCGNTDMVLASRSNRDTTKCPRCNRGRMHCSEEWIS